VQLIPRLKGWVNTNYPGTSTGITEYNWGAESHINGATAQADIFGILGREGLDMAARWATPASSTPTYKAMKMYRNYDGNKSTFHSRPRASGCWLWLRARHECPPICGSRDDRAHPPRRDPRRCDRCVAAPPDHRSAAGDGRIHRGRHEHRRAAAALIVADSEP